MNTFKQMRYKYVFEKLKVYRSSLKINEMANSHSLKFSSPSKRRKIEPPEVGISEFSGSCSSATVHGVVLELSPVKESRKNSSMIYFHGKVSD